jgi:hypothetical protein
MRHQSVVITAPFATPEQVARSYRISKVRAKEIRAIVETSLMKKGYLTREENKASRNGTKNGVGATRVSLHAKKSKSMGGSRRKSKRGKKKTSR